MELREKIKQDLKKALQNKEELRLLVLRGINSAIQNKEIEKRSKLSKSENVENTEEKSKLTEQEIMDVISSEVKKRKDAIEEFSAIGGSASGGKKEKIENIIKKEKSELEILKKYLPKQMSEEQIKQEANKVIDEVNAVSAKDIGKVMGGLMPKLKGKADGNLVNKVVIELLKEK